MPFFGLASQLPTNMFQPDHLPLDASFAMSVFLTGYPIQQTPPFSFDMGDVLISTNQRERERERETERERKGQSITAPHYHQQPPPQVTSLLHWSRFCQEVSTYTLQLPPVAALPINACTYHLTKESTVPVLPLTSLRLVYKYLQYLPCLTCR
jgi:hypothetical protein